MSIQNHIGSSASSGLIKAWRPQAQEQSSRQLSAIAEDTVFIHHSGSRAGSHIRQAANEALLRAERLDDLERALRNGADVNAVDAEGKTALMKAAENADEEMVKALLKRPDIDVHRLDHNGDNAMIHALKGRRTAAAKHKEDMAEGDAWPSLDSYVDGPMFKGAINALKDVYGKKEYKAIKKAFLQAENPSFFRSLFRRGHGVAQ